jgi:hypothetical protein
MLQRISARVNLWREVCLHEEIKKKKWETTLSARFKALDWEWIEAEFLFLKVPGFWGKDGKLQSGAFHNARYRLFRGEKTHRRPPKSKRWVQEFSFVLSIFVIWGEIKERRYWVGQGTVGQEAGRGALFQRPKHLLHVNIPPNLNINSYTPSIYIPLWRENSNLTCT